MPTGRKLLSIDLTLYRGQPKTFYHTLALITSEREARSEFLTLKIWVWAAGRPAGPPAVVTLLRGLYLWNRKPDWQAVFFGG